MNHRINLILTVSIFFFLIGCNTEKTRDGLEFKKLRRGNQEIVKPGEFLLLHVVAKDHNDSIWFDTRVENQPAMVRVDPPNDKIKEKGEVGVYRMLGKNDSVTFTVDVKTIYHDTWRKPVPAGLDPNLKVDYFLSVVDVLNDQTLPEYQKAQEEKLQKLQMEHRVMQFGKDTTLIDEYLRNRSINALKTVSGIRYQVLKPGKGKDIDRGSVVFVRYKGYLLDGKVFDSNLDKKDPFQVVVGSGQVISGWDEMLKEMTLGSKYVIYLPSLFGYGDRILPEIPKDSVLIFEMEVVKIL